MASKIWMANSGGQLRIIWFLGAKGVFRRKRLDSRVECGCAPWEVQPILTTDAFWTLKLPWHIFLSEFASGGLECGAINAFFFRRNCCNEIVAPVMLCITPNPNSPGIQKLHCVFKLVLVTFLTDDCYVVISSSAWWCAFSGKHVWGFETVPRQVLILISS